MTQPTPFGRTYTGPDYEPLPEPATHTPCCSAHGVPMTCARYRRTHFVEVRPCCAIDRQILAAEPAEAPELSEAEARFLDRPDAPESLRERLVAALVPYVSCADCGSSVGITATNRLVAGRAADAALDVVLTDARR